MCKPGAIELSPVRLKLIHKRSNEIIEKLTELEENEKFADDFSHQRQKDYRELKNAMKKLHRIFEGKTYGKSQTDRYKDLKPKRWA